MTPTNVNGLPDEDTPSVTIMKLESTGIANADSRTIFDYADALRQVGRRRESLHFFDQLDLISMPESKRWLVCLYKGQVLMEIGRFSHAAIEFRRACELDTTTVPRVYLARALADQELFLQAIAELEEALKLEGDLDEVHLNIALNQRAIGRLDLSYRSTLRALEITDGYEPAKRLLRDLEAALGMENS